MWRAMFLSVGIYACILGVEALGVERAVLHVKAQPTSQGLFLNPVPAQRVIVPPEWAPWSLLSGGAVVIIYSMTLKRGGKEG